MPLSVARERKAENMRLYGARRKELNMEKYLNIVVLFYFFSRTVYAYYHFFKRKLGKVVFAFGCSSPIMRLMGCMSFILLILEEIENRIKGYTFFSKANIIWFIIFFILEVFLIYFGSKKIRIHEKGIFSSAGCWKWEDIESYKFEYGLNNDKIKILCITVPKYIFMFGSNKIRYKINPNQVIKLKEELGNYIREKE